jgi:hypothetical protein
LIKAIRDHLRKPIRAVFVPKSALMLAVAGAGFGARLLGMAPPLSRGKLRELFWDDWLSSRETLRPIAGWQPQVQFEEGFARTWLGYQEHGWI